ncbi:hypothetical protein PFLUV_G00105490 [Perca fluviatilis]|uniref:C-type lectin domain-containing protein n=1 Tax=Perca fluviatilis TaxID=8168 RepID=A0A6A5FAY9_PERFL|nr:hypothetical protein PFLUV_G00105490 [Perca fluviatilis]
MQWSLFVFIVMGQCSSIGGQLYDYHFIGEEKTWKEAQEYCRTYHTDLATVANETDMKRLLNSTTAKHAKYQAGAWIGLQHNTTNTVWRWSQSGVEFNEKNKISSENIHISHQKMNWTDAQRFCRQNYTDLISGVKKLEEFKTQRQNYPKQPQNNAEPFWIGLFRDCWSWSDGSSFSFRSWDKDEPKKQDPEKTCAMTTSDGKWSADDCNKTKPFFCYNDSVILINQSMIWEDALYYCRDHYRDLVSITNQDDQRWVQERAKMASTPHVWLGLRYTCTLDFWFWVSDETVRYTNWDLPQPGDDCNMSGAMARNGTWVKLIDDDHKLNFICSK